MKGSALSHHSQSREYVVKYLGIVEGNVGCLSRKMVMPNKVSDKTPMGVDSKHMRPYSISGQR